MKSAHRTLLSLLSLTLVFGLSIAPALSAQQVLEGENGTLTITFRYQAEIIATKEFKDRTSIDQTATISCPLTAGGPMTTSSILPQTEKQEQAIAQLGAAAKKEVEAIEPETVSGLESLDKQMKDCKSSGKSEQICGMEIMAAMQSDPELLVQMGEMGGADAEGMAEAKQAVSDAAENYLPWYNEGCVGTMTVNNSFQADDPTIPGPEPVLRTTGTRKIETQETLVTVETELNRNETRYMIIPPQEKFHRDAYAGEQERDEMLAAIPAPLIIGPYPGPIQAGRYTQNLNGGSYSVDWEFARGK